MPGCLGACCYLNGWTEGGKEGQGAVCPEPQPTLWWGVVERVGGFSESPVPSHCLISAPRTRLFWKHGKMPTKKARWVSGCSAEGQQLFTAALGSCLDFPFCFFQGLIRHQLNPAVASSAPSQREKLKMTLFPNNCKCIV